MGFMSVPQGSGDFIPYIKYDARAGRWHTKMDGDELEEVGNMTAIFDMDSLKTGWFEYFEGQAPEKTFDPSLSEAAPKPGEKAKRGFLLNIYSEKNIGGLREFSSTAACVIESMNTLYDEWQAGKDANTGKMPVVKCKGVTSIKTAKSTNYAPALEIVSWADRPDAFDEVPEQKDAGATPTPAPAAAEHTPPPTKEPAMADDDVEF